MKEILSENVEAAGRALVAACDAVNADPALNALVHEWQSVNEPIVEPWGWLESGSDALDLHYAAARFSPRQRMAG